MPKKISVLISVFNREKYIEQAINSVIDQTETDWELIIINDGSTDHSDAIIQKYQKHITIYANQDNQGLSKAMNRAFQYATGEYISLLAADDYYAPHALATLSEYLDRNKNVGLVDADGYVVDTNGRSKGLWSSYRFYPNYENIVDSLLVSNFVNIGDTAMIRHSELEAIAGPFDENMIGYEDWDIALRLAANGCEMRFIDTPVCYYRTHTGQKSSPKNERAVQRQKSLEYLLLKIMNSDLFSSALLETRCIFFRNALLQFSKASPDFQNQILDHKSFKTLPAIDRAHLLYQLGVENLCFDGLEQWGYLYLKEAHALQPHNLKYKAIMNLAAYAPNSLQLSTRYWRRFRKLFSHQPNAYVAGG